MKNFTLKQLLNTLAGGTPYTIRDDYSEIYRVLKYNPIETSVCLELYGDKQVNFIRVIDNVVHIELKVKE